MHDEWLNCFRADLRRRLEFDALDIVVYKQDSNEIEWRSPVTDNSSSQEIEVAESLYWTVYQNREAVWIEDCRVDGDCSMSRQILRASCGLNMGYRSFCGVPIETSSRRLGVLALAGFQPNLFTADDVELLSRASSQLSVVIENSLYRDSSKHLEGRITDEDVFAEDAEQGDNHFAGMVGRSAALRRVLKQVEIVASTNSTVLIFGETGTGKELVARAIHDLSSRRQSPFVTLNCAAIPTGLLESELFGHEKGAFTGAIAQRMGRFELANRGTIFLDEIGEISLELQPKLLRVLQQREFERLGSGRTLKTDARLVAATNRDLKAMVEEQKFRADLFYRLHVFPLHVPPLRERTEDIPLLVRHFVQIFSRRMNRRIETVPAETMEGLVRYNWPGNIRELENVIERAVILSPGSVLRVPLQDLRCQVISSGAGATAGTLEEVERAQILATLKETRWVLSGPNGAAIRLGLNRSTLQFRMKKLGISRPGM
ncbi:sigma-54-dependent Fis family transcriptional regulator [Acidicapsa ligni]|uniref:sigma-54-dependent Fis family transcriptional regulator n=1 Tax=Acidicapsa ligni TaxID=542300 RepID=UPI0021DF505B|nr:sigma 54-interacting transcriptional regulator [Acidicapsa ligni]